MLIIGKITVGSRRLNAYNIKGMLNFVNTFLKFTRMCKRPKPGPNEKIMPVGKF